MTTENLPSLLPSQSDMNTFQMIAKSAQASGLYAGIGGEAKIFMIMLAARELGISPLLAINGGIWNINGKIEISARLMNSMIRRAGHSIKVIYSDDQKCTLLGKRTDGDTFECTFTIDEAAKAGLTGRDVWKKYASDMLYNRCMSRLARRLFPDVIGTAYIEGELSEDVSKPKNNNIENLQQAECEDVTNSNKQEVQQSQEPQEAKVSEDQLNELSKLYAATDDSFKENFSNHMTNKWNAVCLDDIPASAFNVCKIGMQKNIAEQQTKQQQVA